MTNEELNKFKRAIERETDALIAALEKENIHLRCLHINQMTLISELRQEHEAVMNNARRELADLLKELRKIRRLGDTLAHQLPHIDHPFLLDKWWEGRGGHEMCTVCNFGRPAEPAVHDSDCAVHNHPAMPPGPCDCGAEPSAADQAG